MRRIRLAQTSPQSPPLGGTVAALILHESVMVQFFIWLLIMAAIDEDNSLGAQ